jgi:predicted Zn finger-like uncharacterized protein
MIRIKCPACSTALNVKDDAAGKLVACPRCKERIKVPAEDSDETDDAPVRPAAKPKAAAPRPAPAPAPKKKVAPPPEEDLDDIEPEDDDPRPRKKPAPAKPAARPTSKRAREEEPEDYDDEDEDDIDEDEDEEDDRARKKGKKNKKGKKGRKGAPANTGNMITGIIFTVVGVLITAAAWIVPLWIVKLDNPWQPETFGTIAGLALLAYGMIKFFQE